MKILLLIFSFFSATSFANDSKVESYLKVLIDNKTNEGITFEILKNGLRDSYKISYVIGNKVIRSKPLSKAKFAKVTEAIQRQMEFPPKNVLNQRLCQSEIEISYFTGKLKNQTHRYCMKRWDNYNRDKFYRWFKTNQQMLLK